MISQILVFLLTTFLACSTWLIPTPSSSDCKLEVMLDSNLGWIRKATCPQVNCPNLATNGACALTSITVGATTVYWCTCDHNTPTDCGDDTVQYACVQAYEDPQGQPKTVYCMQGSLPCLEEESCPEDINDYDPPMDEWTNDICVCHVHT